MIGFERLILFITGVKTMAIVNTESSFLNHISVVKHASSVCWVNKVEILYVFDYIILYYIILYIIILRSSGSSPCSLFGQLPA